MRDLSSPQVRDEDGEFISGIPQFPRRWTCDHVIAREHCSTPRDPKRCEVLALRRNRGGPATWATGRNRRRTDAQTSWLNGLSNVQTDVFDTWTRHQLETSLLIARLLQLLHDALRVDRRPINVFRMPVGMPVAWREHLEELFPISCAALVRTKRVGDSAQKGCADPDIGDNAVLVGPALDERVFIFGQSQRQGAKACRRGRCGLRGGHVCRAA